MHKYFKEGVPRFHSGGHRWVDDTIKLQKYPPELRCFCFSTVRNPFDWLISLWHFNWGRQNTSGPGLQSVWRSLETFLYEFNSHEKCGETPWDVPAQEDRPPAFSFRHLQTCQTFDALNTPGKKFSFAKFYIRLEKLEHALDPWKDPRRRIPIANRSDHRDYRTYYDTKLIDHISAHRRQELDLLGYDFEGPTDDLSVFRINKPFVVK